MKKGFLIFIFIVFMCSIAFVSAGDNSTIVGDSHHDALADSEDIEHGSVSGDVVVASSNPMNTTGELNYKIPSDAKNIKKADIYVNVYSGSGTNKWGAYANVSLITYKGTSQLGMEELRYDYVEDTMYDSEVYVVNDHITKSVSDYQIHYDVLDIFKDLKTSSFVTVHVDTFKHPEKQFDGRIKSIALVMAYDDGDDDVVNYWIDTTQRWTQDTITDTFNTDFITKDNFIEANLVNIALSSNEGLYMMNDNILIQSNHVTGSYYQYNRWDVSDYIIFGQNTTFSSKAASSIYSKDSLKNVLSLLKIKNGILKVKTTLTTEYQDTCYAGTNNVLTVIVNANKPGNYRINLYADGNLVDNATCKLNSGNNKVYLTDGSIRNLDESTVMGNVNNHVNYAVKVFLNDSLVGSNQLTVPVLYNGYLSKEFAYPSESFEPFFNETFSGDFVIDIKTTPLSSSAMSIREVWNVSLNDSSGVINGLLYVPYNWFNGEQYTEDEAMFDVTFNDVEIHPISFSRDQSNIGGYGRFGYGILIYNVTDLIENGENVMVLNKRYPSPALYPPALVYVTNNTLSKFTKRIYAVSGVDVLYNEYNLAKRAIRVDTDINVNLSDVADAVLYVLAASAERNDGDIVFNNKTFSNVWRGTSTSTSLFKANITEFITQNNTISFVATGSTIVALPVFIVTSNNGTEIAIECSEYENVSYAGTSNIMTVVVNTNNAGLYTINLYDGLVRVNNTEVYLSGTDRVLITDPTVRPIDGNTVYGKDNVVVTYTAELLLGGEVISTSQLPCSVLYNGYLSKDYAYNASAYAPYEITFTGNLIVDTKDAASYLSEFDPKRTDSWNINLDGNSNIVKSFVYVPFTGFNPKFSFDSIGAVFNGVDVSPCEIHIDRPNLANDYCSGVFIYDVSSLIKDGENTFALTKGSPTPAMYPSALVYMYNTTGSGSIKTLSMLNGVDLLSNDYNLAGRTVQTDNIINVSSSDLANAEIYVMAAGDRGNVVVNGKIFEDVFNESEKATGMFKANIMDIVKDSNSVSFEATGSNILALQQFIVVTKNVKEEPKGEDIPVQPAVNPAASVTKQTTKITASKKTFKAKVKVKKYTITLKSGKKALKGFKVTLKIKGKTFKATTNAKGKATFKITKLTKKGKYTAKIKFAGNANYSASTKNVKITVKK